MRRGWVVAIVIAMVAVNVAGWAGFGWPIDGEPSWYGRIKGLSFSPFQRDESPFRGDRPSVEEVDGDLAIVAEKTDRIRTYGGDDASEDVLQRVGRHGIRVSLGAWIKGKRKDDEAEIARIVELAKHNRNVDRVIVGNEALLRRDVSVMQLIAYLRLMRAQVTQPVSTAEPWHVWMEYPELADAVDFVAVHILPYWEGIHINGAVEYIMIRQRRLQAIFPNKPVVLLEVGWPTEGRVRAAAVPSVENQAIFVRRFLKAAHERNLDYYIMEAFDQPWKAAEEGSVGAYWGLWNAGRQPKFSYVANIEPLPNWPFLAALSSAGAALFVLWFASRNRLLKPAGLAFFAALTQGAVSLALWTVFVGSQQYLSPLSLALWTIMLTGQAVLYARLFGEGFELTELFWRRRWRRQPKPSSALPPVERAWPKVSLHLPICREPPEMVIRTLQRLALLDYPNLEVLVIDNNTRDAAIWRPVEDACQRLGERFRFFHLESCQGFKAGALNFALAQTVADAEIVGVIDSDYLVERQWLKTMVPQFDRPKVGFVQSPQDHYDWSGNGFKTMLNWEYAGFFHAGMVQRNERNAIIQHGTMTLIRKAALAKLGGWAEWTICEDAELGMRLMHAGYESVYSPEVLGRGVTPDGFAAYRTQRFRWAFGAMQILRRHWRWFLTEKGGLSAGQRFHFIAGWLPWLSDALGVLFTVMGLVWTVGLILFPKTMDFPLTLFLLPTLGMFAFKTASVLALYGGVVRAGLWQTLGALIAGLSLNYAVAKAVMVGCFTTKRPFVRTPKLEGHSTILRGLVWAWEETLFLVALLAAAFAVYEVHGGEQRDEALWIAVLLTQAIPFAASVACSLLGALPALGFGRVRQPATSRPALGTS
ncbi:MAG: glycosyltransferase [Alphaproteobacteria bacterium]|nr:glycosyltransferase [Alphaproteobacteria bacterium]